MIAVRLTRDAYDMALNALAWPWRPTDDSSPFATDDGAERSADLAHTTRALTTIKRAPIASGHTCARPYRAVPAR